MKQALIRIAHKEDTPVLMELIRELAIFELAPNEVTVTLDEFIDAGFGTDPVWKAFVAEVDHQIVGMSLFYVRYSTWKGKKLYLEDLIVTEKFRKTGIGKLLFETTLQYAQENNFKGLVWQVLDWNESAIKFYDRYQSKYDAGWLNGSIDF
jgi:GNAT superfamily N-acetyltransferase